MLEKELLEQIKNKPELGFASLLEEYQQPLYFYVRKIVFSHDDASDIMQNVWIKVFKNIQKFRGDSKLSTWLYRIATNETYTYLNQKSKDKFVEINEILLENTDALSLGNGFTGEEIERELYRAVANLPDKQRQIFQLKYFENKKYEEISEILGTSVGALKASYHHAVQKIKNQLPKNII